jgi:tetratricopeptide (TPR) repeat protein
MLTMTKRILAPLLALVLLLPACDLLDVTSVENPQTTFEDLADAPNPTRAMLPGLEAQFARALSAVVTTTAAVSDSYSVQNSGLSRALDLPRSLTPGDPTLNTTGGAGAYWNLQELRALADFVIEEIIPGDETATGEEIARAHFYRGMAFLMQGENFGGVPVAPSTAPLPPADLLALAAADFAEARETAPAAGVALHATAALARTHRALGQTAEAAREAEAALAPGASFVYAQQYDPNPLLLTNGPWAFLVDRSLQELQPLPRLDFLDPKYTTPGAAIPVAKAEEMHLILAEAALASGEAERAREHLASAASLARSRPTVTFEENDVRSGAGFSIRPRDAAIKVRADANSPFVGGLVLQRPGMVDVPAISATHITPDSIRAVPTSDGVQLRRLLFALRQEILFLEGRRMHDLGVRLPMMLREIETSPVIEPGDPGTQVQVPAYLPADADLDAFTPLSPYNRRERLETDEITITVDLNRVLAEERSTVLQNPRL